MDSLRGPELEVYKRSLIGNMQIAIIERRKDRKDSRRFRRFPDFIINYSYDEAALTPF